MSIKVIKETKFKDVLVSIRFRSLLEQEKVVNKVLLSDILSNACNQYLTKQEVANKLDSLYGASFSTNCMTYGKSQVLEFSTKAIHSSYIKNELNLLEEQIKLLSTFILSPKVDEKGDFATKDVEEAKRITLAKIARSLDEPSQLCSHNLINIIGKGYALGINPSNHVEDIQKITNHELKVFYDEMLKKDAIDLIVVGDVDEEEVERLFYKYFNLQDRNPSIETSYAVKQQSFQPWYYGDKDITQTYISMVYATQTQNIDKDFWALRVANGILGQTPSSLLFREVREKHSLCYSIYSNVLAYDGVLGINVGVDPENVNKTVELIQEQFSRVCAGDFEKETFETTKMMLVNAVNNYHDDMNALASLAYRDIILNVDESIEKMIQTIEKVTVEDAIKAMNKCVYLSGYVLQKGGSAYEVDRK